MANKKLWVIGVGGTNGSGKDTFCEVLAKHHNYLFISVTELLRAECKRRNLPVERENLRVVSAEWRRELGLGVLVDKSVAEYEVNRDKYSGLVVASLRNPGEADRIHQLDGTMVWIDADPKLRYKRIQDNIHVRGRSEEDSKTFEEFMQEEADEMHPYGDEATLHMAGVKDKSDIFLDNSSDDRGNFRLQVEQKLGL